MASDPQAPVMRLQSVRPLKRSKLFWALSDSRMLIWRTMTHIVRNFDQLLSVAMQPIMFTLLFRYVFGGAIETEGITYANFLFAGILVQTVAFGSSYTAMGVATDLSRGVIDRFKSLPMWNSAVLVGHTVADLVRNTISAVIMILVGLLVGFRPNATPLEWLYAFGILLAFSFALSWLTAIVGMIAKSIEAVQWITFVFIMPITFASTAFVPPEGMPAGLRAFVENQPVTHTIEAIRSLTAGTPMGDHAWLSLVWSAAILIVAVPLTGYLFRTRASR